MKTALVIIDMQNGTESHLRGLEVLRETITKDRVIGVTDVQSLLEDNI